MCIIAVFEELGLQVDAQFSWWQDYTLNRFLTLVSGKIGQNDKGQKTHTAFPGIERLSMSQQSIEASIGEAETEKLVTGLTGDDPNIADECFTKIWKYHVAMVCSIFIKHNVEDHSLIQELAQKVAIKVWENRKKYDPNKGKLTTWITVITRNTALDEIRYNGRRHKLNSEYQTILDSRGEVFTINPATEQDALKVLYNRIQRRGFTNGDRQIFELFMIQGFTQQEIAIKAAEPLGTIKARCLRLREKLKRLSRNGYQII